MNGDNVLLGICESRLFRNQDSKKLVVFLPPVNNKNFYPYYARISWAPELAAKVNVLYVSDPYQPLEKYKEPKGSWFISPDGESALPLIAEKIADFSKNNEIDEVLFYGSSMGGYSAIILSSLLQNSSAVAECPQLFLKKHPGSRYVTENIAPHGFDESLFEPFFFIKKGYSKYIEISCSIYDRHYRNHVLPFVRLLELEGEIISTKIDINFFSDTNYKKGHVARFKEEAFTSINRILKLC